jgi:hypothetical protein
VQRKAVVAGPEAYSKLAHDPASGKRQAPPAIGSEKTMYGGAAAGIDRTPSEPRCGPSLWTTAAFRKDAGQKALICEGIFESGWGTWILRSPPRTLIFRAFRWLLRRSYL